MDTVLSEKSQSQRIRAGYRTVMNSQNDEGRAGCWWLKPVILASQEAEDRRITVQSLPWANSS
jgi:hypothetical protein